MGDIDHLTEDAIVSRGFDEDEEREMEEKLEAAPQPKVFVNWTKATRSQFEDGKLRPKLLLIATSRVGCLLLHHQISSKKVAGAVVLPEVSLSGCTLAPSLADPTCTLYSTAAAAAAAAAAERTGGREGQPQEQGGDVMLALCQVQVPAVRARAWVKALFQHVIPDQVLILGSAAPAVALNGTFLVETDASKRANTDLKRDEGFAPFLPPGHVVSDLPAAILSHCQIRGIAAKLIINVDRALVTDSIALLEMRNTVCKELGHQSQFGNLFDVKSLNAAQKGIDAELDASSYSSLFV